MLFKRYVIQNPISRRLARHPMMPLRQRYLFVSVLIAGSTSIFLLALFFDMPGSVLFFPLLLYGLYLFVPAMIGLMGFDLLRDEVRNQSYEVLKLTLLRNVAIVEGYYHGMLYRLRWLIPAGGVVLVELMVVMMRLLNENRLEGIPGQVMMLFFVSMTGIALAGLNLLAAAIGVQAGMLWPHGVPWQTLSATGVYVLVVLLVFVGGLVGSALIFSMPMFFLARAVFTMTRDMLSRSETLPRSSWE